MLMSCVCHIEIRKLAGYVEGLKDRLFIYPQKVDMVEARQWLVV